VMTDHGFSGIFIGKRFYTIQEHWPVWCHATAS